MTRINFDSITAPMRKVTLRKEPQKSLLPNSGTYYDFFGFTIRRSMEVHNLVSMFVVQFQLTATILI